MEETTSTLTKKRQRFQPLFFAVLPMSLYLIDIFGFYFLGQQAKGWPLAFGALWTLIVGGLLFLLPRKAARICYGIAYFLALIYAGFQTGYYVMFGQMMWLSDFRYASEGADYISVLLSYPALWWIGLLALIAIGVILLWKFPRWELKKGTMLAAVAICGGAMIGAALLPQTVFYFDYQELRNGSEADTLAAGDYGRMQSAEAAYENMFNAHRLYEVCGLSQTLCKDIYTHYIYPMTPAYASAQKQAKEELDGYFDQRTDEKTNEMTGILEGKNVILVLMESMDDWMIGEHTPTISRLMSEGINFTQFYTPAYGGIRTFNSEFCINTGSFLSSDGGYAFDYVTNTYDHSLANQLRNQGYSAKVFHYNDPAFYSRGVFSPAMGYEEYVYYKDYVSDEQWKTAQYDDTLLFTNEELCNEFFREGQTFNFIITRSAHLSYTYNEALSHWGLQKYPEYRGLTGEERTDCALLKARLVDDMFTALLEQLETRGELENTVIIGITDHYSYGYRIPGSLELDRETIYELSGVDQELLLEKIPCFIWSADLQAREVDKTLNTADLLPTLLNMLGIDSSYSYLGQDAFDEAYEGYALFSDGSWISGNLAFDAAENLLFTLDGTQPQEDRRYERAVQGYYDDIVEEFVSYNNLILKADYYR